MLRWIAAVALLAFLAVVLLFAVQNLTNVEVFVLTWKLTMPKAVLILVSYVLGMVTGSALFGFLLRSVKKLADPEG